MVGYTARWYIIVYPSENGHSSRAVGLFSYKPSLTYGNFVATLIHKRTVNHSPASRSTVTITCFGVQTRGRSNVTTGRIVLELSGIRPTSSATAAYGTVDSGEWVGLSPPRKLSLYVTGWRSVGPIDFLYCNYVLSVSICVLSYVNKEMID